MAYYHTCPICGCNLDPGEKCDCEEVAAKEREEDEALMAKEEGTGQMVLRWGQERERMRI